jgi:CDP-glycerol glycerophosphotransferase
LLTRDFNYPGDVLEIGYPRNDVLMSDEAPQLRASVRTALGIPEGARAILYAPTFRDYLSEDDHTAPMADLLDADALMRALGDDHVLLIRGHAFHARTEERPDVADRVIDVTDYPEPADLYLASDLAIVDYSSLRFDYGLTGKPMLFLVPDLDLYKQTRGWLIEYEPTAPGPLLASTDEVADAIKDLDRVVSDHAEAYATRSPVTTSTSTTARRASASSTRSSSRAATLPPHPDRFAETGFPHREAALRWFTGES